MSEKKMAVILQHKNSIRGTVNAPGDKSLTHRAIITAALSEGDTKISHFLRCADTISTIACLQKLGISIEDLGNDEILVHGKGMYGLRNPNTILNVGNSGTTSRLLLAILSSMNFESEIRGDDAINIRSMKKIIKPLQLMGANIKSCNYSTPLNIYGSELKGIEYEVNNISAQVKSALLFAGLFAKTPMNITETIPSRDHTERVLRHFGANIISKDSKITINPGNHLIANDINIPGDLSSAAFLMAAALILPNSELLLKNVGVNESRLGFITAVQQMGGDLQFINAKNGIEPCTDILVRSSKLHGIRIERDQIPSSVDELPILAVLSCFAEGETVITDASELKRKETDRVDALVENLTRMGASIRADGDEIIINGGIPLNGAIVGSRLDHRIAMCMSIAGICAQGTTELIGSHCVGTSYPNFFKDLEKIAL